MELSTEFNGNGKRRAGLQPLTGHDAALPDRRPRGVGGHGIKTRVPEKRLQREPRNRTPVPTPEIAMGYTGNFRGRRHRTAFGHNDL